MTFRITFGKASPARWPSLTQRQPSGAAVERGTCAVNTVSASGKWVKT